jgi:ribonuclease PH
LLGERTITIDADVLQADAGTRSTAITGGYVALAHAIAQLQRDNELLTSPLRHPVAAVSVGLIHGEPFLDLNYPEDLAAEVDLNVVMTEKLDLIEVQGTAEDGTYSRSQLNQMLDLAEKGIASFVFAQKAILSQENRVMAGV